MAKLTINDVSVDVPDGTSVIAAADKAGVFIPRFCYHPDLVPAGNCRICQVEIEGNPKMTVSCMTPVKDGMVVRSDTDKVKKAVQGDLEFLLLNHPVDCPICDQAGECYLQDYYMAVGQHSSRVPLGQKVRKKKVVDLGDMIVLDSERCVMCSRCIRFSDDVSKTRQFGFFNRGSKMEIGTFRDRPLDDPYSGCYADVCPVGALTSKTFRFSSRVWFLKQTDSICPNCSTGCNIRVDHKEGRAHRFVPRRNADVNKSWMCDIGRLSFAELHGSTRLRAPQLRREGALADVDWETAIEATTSAYETAKGGGGAVVGLATPRATCEELWAFRGLIAEGAGSSHLDYRVVPTWDRVDEREDEVLRRVDHQPNSRGAELLGIVPAEGGWDVKTALERAAAGDVHVLHLLGPELLLDWPDKDLVAKAIAGARYVIVHDRDTRAEHDGIDCVLPAAAFAEIDGSFVNHAGRLQRLRKAIPPPGGSRATVDVLGELHERLAQDARARTAREVFKSLSGVVAAFGGLDLERISPLGVVLDGLDGKEAA